jgi:L-alanine-DL-glutamate epimerase-like enolase superfamily enzyme
VKITQVRARLLDVPIEYPHLAGTTDVTVVLLEIETDTQVSGHALCFYPMASAVVAFLNDDVAPMLVGYDPTATERVRTDLGQRLTNRVLGGVWSSAASLVDLALWDIIGKAYQAPVWRLLGGARAEVDVYVTYGLPRYSTAELVLVAKELVDAGHRGLKLVVGASSAPSRGLFGVPTRQDIRHDAARVRAVRDAVGSDVELMVDANKNPTLDLAVALAREIEDCDITWFEDPLVMGDGHLMAELRDRTSIPVAGGSLGMGDVRVLRELLVARSMDIVQPNVRDIGGYTGGRKAAALAEAFNLPIAMGGNWPHLNMHLYAGVPNGGLVEFHLQGWSVAKQLYRNPPEPEGSVLRLPEEPGLGLELDLDAVARCAR